MSWIENPTSLPTWEAIVDAVTKFMDAGDMDDNIRQLFIDVAGRLGDSGWTALSITNANWATAGVPNLWRQVGPAVQVVGTLTVATGPFTSGTAWGASVFGVLPPAARPAQQIQAVQATAFLGNGTAEGKLDTDGSIQFRNTGAASLPVGTVIGCYFNYFAG